MEDLGCSGTESLSKPRLTGLSNDVKLDSMDGCSRCIRQLSMERSARISSRGNTHRSRSWAQLQPRDAVLFI